jgi:hypothetical protein
VANALYPKGKEGILDGTIALSSGTIKAALLRSYTYGSAHEDLADITGAGGTIVASSGAIGSKTFTSGVFDAADVTWTAVANGAACNNFVLYQDGATDADRRVIMFVDSYTNLPVTPNGGDITIEWDSGSNKIFSW